MAELTQRHYDLLSRSEGFRVDSPQGHVGKVKWATYGSHPNRPDALAVGTGFLGRRVVLVEIEEVERVLAAERRILLRRSP